MQVRSTSGSSACSIIHGHGLAIGVIGWPSMSVTTTITPSSSAATSAVAAATCGVHGGGVDHGGLGGDEGVDLVSGEAPLLADADGGQSAVLSHAVDGGAVDVEDVLDLSRTEQTLH
jgi:hypothetical protein